MMSGILVISFSATQPEELIKNILGANDSPKSEHIYSNIKSYPWHLETKYYTVDLFLHTVEDIVACPEFVDTIEAIIIHFDPLEEKSFESLASQFSVINSYEAEVQILACDSLNQARDNVTHLDRSNKYLEWCVKHKFELVELSPSSHSEDDDKEEDDYEEISGYRRILGALQAHVWPHLKMKDKHNTKLDLGSHAEASLRSGIDTNESSDKSFIDKDLSRAERLDSLMDNEFLQSVRSGDSSLSFEELFQKFSEMKVKAATLTGDERKQYAEEVTVAFWKAIGGDEEEIVGLSGED